MKRILFAFLLLVSSVISWAQTRDDGFASYNDMVGKDVVLYGLYSLYSQNGAFIFTMQNGKLKAIKEEYYYKIHDVELMSFTDIVIDKNKSYLKGLTSKSDEVFFLFNKKNNMLPIARSKTYWDEIMSQYSKRYGYIKYPSYFTGTQEDVAAKYLHKYLPLKWEAVVMPNDFDGEVSYSCRIGNLKVPLSDEIIKQHENDFVSLNDYYSEKRAYDEAISESIRQKEAADAKLDSTLICEAMIRHTASAITILDKQDISYDDRDTLWLSIYQSKNVETGYGSLKKTIPSYEGFLFGSPTTFSADDLVFADDSQSKEAKSFVDRRGNTGVETRKQLASKNDSIRSYQSYEIKVKHLELLGKVLTKIDDFRKQKKIFILSQEYAYSEYQFGLRFKFFNCYNKVIKYVDIKATAYNQVGDVQKDYFGESSKTVRGIGPIEKGEEAEYEFNKMFWDEYDIIHHLTVVDIKITFMDGSVVRYSGKENVKQHTSSYYSEEQKKILNDLGYVL